MDLRQPSRWDSDGPLGLENLMGTVNELVPQNHTPLAEAIVLAREQGFPPATEYQGPRGQLRRTSNGSGHTAGFGIDLGFKTCWPNSKGPCSCVASR